MKPVVGYLLNPDKVFYNILDNVLIQLLKDKGNKVISMNLEDVSIKATQKGIELFNKNTKVNLSGFMSYGYMRKFNFEAYQYLIGSLSKMNVHLIYTPEQMNILSNKFRQAVQYSTHHIPIPTTSIAFSINSFKSHSKQFFPKESVLKELTDYGGDGVQSYNNKESLVNSAAKLLWRNEFSLIQEYIADSFGRSIRVLCVDNKPIACAEYINKSNNFKSNCAFGYSNFTLKSLMNDPRKEKYYALAIKAINSIDNGKNITLAGVDILDSKHHGSVVLEVNPWPDLFDTKESTKVDVFDKFISAYSEKLKH